MKTKVIVLAIALVAMTGAVNAQNTTKKQTTNTTQQGPNFVDTNKNGVCDNFENGKGGNNPKGDGVQLKDGSGRTSGKGKRAAQGQGLKDGSGKGGRGAYVDANKNGVCDNREKK